MVQSSSPLSPTASPLTGAPNPTPSSTIIYTLSPEIKNQIPDGYELIPIDKLTDEYEVVPWDQVWTLKFVYLN